MPGVALANEGEAADGGVVTLEQQAQFLHGEIRRTTAFCGRQILDLPRPRQILLATEDQHDTRLAEFLAAAATPDTPVSCRMLEAGEAVPLPLREEVTGGLLLSLGLALRSAPAVGPASHLNLVAPAVPNAVAPRQQGNRRWIYGLAATVVLGLNVGLGMALRDVNNRAAEGAAVWKVLAEAPTGNKSELGDRVRAARADAMPREAWPERWLALLGTVGGPDVQVTGLQIQDGNVTLAAAVKQVNAVERFKRELEKHLPPQQSTKVTWQPAVDGRPSFILTTGQLQPAQVGENPPSDSESTTPNILQVGSRDEAGN